MWISFGEALAAVAGALTGLLFVAVSVKSEVLAASLSLSSRAAQTLVLFMTAVLVGVAGVTFLLKAGGGLYWLIPAAVTSLVRRSCARRPVLPVRARRRRRTGSW